MHHHIAPKGIFVTGTDTDVGKTYIGCLIIKGLIEQNIKVYPRKPVESGWQKNLSCTDAGLLMRAAQSDEAIEVICPNPLSQPVSPARAAMLEGKSFTIERLKEQCLHNVNTNGFLYVEGAGGFYSPIACDGHNADLAEQLGLPIVLVAEDKLGCINQILLTLEAIETRKLKVQAIILNQTRSKLAESDSMDNRCDLKEYTKAPIFSHGYKQEGISREYIKFLCV